jgi:hypothetical protein
VVALVAAICITLVNRDPAPDEPLADTEEEVEHLSERVVH